MTRYFAITPGDAWFFRDARPFNQADPAQMAVPSLFPPNPTTVVGLLRAALARGRDWPGTGAWRPEITTVLGDGNNLGSLRFSGPYIRFGNNELFPAPTILFGRCEQAGRSRIWKDRALLTPGPELRSDLDTQPVRLPVFVGKREERDPLFDKYYLTPDAMRRVLEGQAPQYDDEIVERDSVAAREPRVRLEIDNDTRTAEPGLLFATEFVRPATRPGASTMLIVGLDGLDDDKPVHSPVAFGGENRWAWIEDWHDDIRVPEPPPIERADNGDLLYTAILVTPADLKTWPRPGEPIAWRTADGRPDGLPGEVVSAALDRPLRPGEWRSVGDGKGPQQSPPLLPAGSTWFLRATAADEDAIRERHRTKIGRRTEWGFGEILIGTWRDLFASKEAT